MKKFYSLMILFLILLTPYTVNANGFETAPFYASGYVPACAKKIVSGLDEQLLVLLGEDYPRSSLRIIFTVPVNLNDFSKTNALSRQITEEISAELKKKGYRVLEYRKGQRIEITPKKGELFLSRDTRKMSKDKTEVELIMVGTYTQTARNVRYNVRLLQATSNEVIASANGTVPVYAEIYPLLKENDIKVTLLPSVKTKL